MKKKEGWKEKEEKKAPCAINAASPGHSLPVLRLSRTQSPLPSSCPVTPSIPSSPPPLATNAAKPSFAVPFSIRRRFCNQTSRCAHSVVVLLSSKAAPPPLSHGLSCSIACKERIRREEKKLKLAGQGTGRPQNEIRKKKKTKKDCTAKSKGARVSRSKKEDHGQTDRVLRINSWVQRKEIWAEEEKKKMG